MPGYCAPCPGNMKTHPAASPAPVSGLPVMMAGRRNASHAPRASPTTTALRASDLRTVTQAGHHVKTIESLELTIKANPKVIQRFKTFNNKRNKSVYDVAGAVSDQELEAMVELVHELKENTLIWLRKAHPELLRV